MIHLASPFSALPSDLAEIASAGLFLCASESTYMTGSIVPVDGGFIAT
jgi:NAD(P)-dependent dehydrogenase (short-subunit alcohol dehydrogenase family)